MIHVFNAHPTKKLRKRPIEKLARSVLRGEGVRANQLNIVFVSDREMRSLNRTYLHHNSTTDVISFRLNEGSAIDGEVYVSIDQAARQAKHYRVSRVKELERLVVHGVLHLIGYFDSTKAGKERMRRKEEHYLEKA